MSVLFIVLMNVSFSAQNSIQYDWDGIKEFRFYGRNNPIAKKETHYILADNHKISELLNHTLKSEGYFPKGIQNYAIIIFNDSKQIIIQILPGLPSPIRAVENELFDDDWFEFDNDSAMKWIKYINELNELLNN